ncbi:MAG: hypothetical protein WDA68_07505 [Phycisphaerae bacterium]
MKLDISQLKTLAAKLGVLKIYSVFILPAVLIAVALFLLFILSPLMGLGLRNQINQTSISSGRQISSLISENISQKQIQAEREYQDILAQDANEIAQRVRQTTQRALLTYNLFPEPQDKSALIFNNFGRRYHEVVEKLVEQIGGKEPPSLAEIEENLKKATGYSPDSSRFSTDAMEGFMPQRQLQANEVEQTIIDELCRSAAKSGLCYINILELPGYDYWDIGSVAGAGALRVKRYQYSDTEQSVRECWHWQLGYWIMEDIFETIAAMNSDCSNILTCPVKRLVALTFGAETSFRMGQEVSSMFSIAPSYVSSENPGLAIPLSDRSNNNKIDTVHFQLNVIVRADSVMSFMEQLCTAKQHVFKGWDGNAPPKTFQRNQIVILNAQMNPVSEQDTAHQLYRYGDGKMVSLELTCEYIFDSEAYDAVKPSFLKSQVLGY